ncbi:MAG: MYXO-CTERM sorting domain-containing protein [Pseudomonadota bacterium]
MKQPIVLGSSLLVVLAFASSASAVTLYAAPDGTATTGCYYDIPCSLDGATKLALPGDTVVLKDGTYTQGIYPPANTQPDPPAYITFKADECALPIIEGVGAAPLDDNQDSGMYADSATYLRFVGIVMRGWSSGFSNKFQDTDPSTPPTSNGHFEYKNCIADGNGRTGFTMFSAEGLHIQNCISAHNGSSILHSWSSGITLLEVQGTGNLVEGNISFENMDNHDVAQAPDSPGKHSDGNGFIVDENSNGVTFVNNIGFGNGGSCLRLTRSSNTKFVNNTCYHNAQDTMDSGPTNPSEVYFTAPSSGQTDPRTGVTFMNNVFWATGTGPGAATVQNKPTSGWTNNIEGKGAVMHFTAPDGMNPDFTLAATATTLIGMGGTNAAVPTNDVGFDPKCIVKKTPTMVGMMAKGSWWQYSIDYDYIKSIGGVAKCFNPGTRSGTPDIGAYKAGAVTASPVVACVPTIPPDHAGPPAGGAGGGGGASVGGATAAGGTAGSSAPGGGSTSTSGSTSTGGGGGAAPGSAGAAIGTGGGSVGSAGAPGAAGASSGTDSGCGCRVGSQPGRSGLLIGLGSFGLAMLALRRRRQPRA